MGASFNNSVMSTLPVDIAEFPSFLPLRRFSTEKYLQMVDSGFLGPSDKVELIAGVVVETSPSGIPHNQFLIQIVDLFAAVLKDCQVAIQATLPLDDGSVFHPDFMLLRRKPEGYKLKYPRPEDVLLVIEAASSSLRRDREIKLPVYAAAGIPEYWITDLEKELVIVHRQPEGSQYQVVEIAQKDEILSPLAAPQFSLKAGKLFE